MTEQTSDPTSDKTSGKTSEKTPDKTSDRSAGKPRKPEGKDRESWIERGVAIRAGFYIFGTHLFAGFVWLLFYLGEHAHK